eukprot:PITA_05024
MDSEKMTSDASLNPAGLVGVALAHGMVVFAMVDAGFNTSGGHINPAVTLGLAVGGNITLLRSFFYLIAQLLGSTVACLLLKFTTGGLVSYCKDNWGLVVFRKFLLVCHSCEMTTSPFTVASGMNSGEAVVMEIILTFGLLYTVYATAIDPKKGSQGAIAPLAIGFVVGANIFAGGPFSGASMNPARAFGPALVSNDWTDHWVYWVGPLIGGPLAGIVYGGIFLTEETHAPVPISEY